MAFLLGHALYKGALFLVAGALDHETGTRDVDRLGGLGRAMPLTAAGRRGGRAVDGRAAAAVRVHRQGAVLRGDAARAGGGVGHGRGRRRERPARGRRRPGRPPAVPGQGRPHPPTRRTRRRPVCCWGRSRWPAWASPSASGPGWGAERAGVRGEHLRPRTACGRPPGAVARADARARPQRRHARRRRRRLRGRGLLRRAASRWEGAARWGPAGWYELALEGAQRAGRRPDAAAAERLPAVLPHDHRGRDGRAGGLRPGRPRRADRGRELVGPALLRSRAGGAHPARDPGGGPAEVAARGHRRPGRRRLRRGAGLRPVRRAGPGDDAVPGRDADRHPVRAGVLPPAGVPDRVRTGRPGGGTPPWRWPPGPS